jgi:hypothetical protein
MHHRPESKPCATPTRTGVGVLFGVLVQEATNAAQQATSTGDATKGARRCRHCAAVKHSDGAATKRVDGAVT